MPVSLAHSTTHPIGQIHSEFPHYDELDEIWWGIPGFDSDLISSDPTVDHTQSLLSLVKVKSNKDTPAAHTQEEDMNIDDGVQDDTNDGSADMIGDNDGHGGLEGEDPLDDNDMQVDDSQDEGGATALNDADQVHIKHRVLS